MSLILRNVKGSALTFTEMDDNLLYLESLGNGASASIAGLSFSAVLGIGNETGGNNIIMSPGDFIINAGQTNEIDITQDNIIKLQTTDSGDITSSFTLDPDGNEDGSQWLELNQDTGESSSIFLSTGSAALNTKIGKDGSSVVTSLTEINDVIVENDISSNLNQTKDSLIFSRTETFEIGGDITTIIFDAGVNGITLDALLGVENLTIKNLRTYANNADAIAGGLSADQVYKTAGGELRIVV
jgi:hypothetical protein